MNNFLTSSNLQRIPNAKGIAATGTVRINRAEKAPLQPVKKWRNLKEVLLMSLLTRIVTERLFDGRTTKWQQQRLHLLEKCPSGKLMVMSKLKMAGLTLTNLEVFSYIIKVWVELIALIKTSGLTWWVIVARNGGGQFSFGSISKEFILPVPSTEALWWMTQVEFTAISAKYCRYML